MQREYTNMERGVNVLILERSKTVAVQLIERIRNIDLINEVLYGSTFDKPINILFSNRLNIVICCIPLTNENVTKLNEIREVCKSFLLIVLSGSTRQEYAKTHPYLSVDYFFNTVEELEQLPEIIMRLTHAGAKSLTNYL